MCALFDTGCRIDHVIKLTTSDVDLDNLLLTVYGKDSKERKVPFSFELRKLLFGYGQFKDEHAAKYSLPFAVLRREGVVFVRVARFAA